MTPRPNRRITPTEIEADRAALSAVKVLNGYTPINPAYSIQAVSELEMAMEQAQREEVRAMNALTAARDAAMAAEWNLHNAILGMNTQVIAQYGPDSDALHALGLKKKSERKRPARRKAA